MHSDRHPVLEYLVFGLAGVLAVILAYYAYARWESGRRLAAPEAPLGRSAQPIQEELPASTGNLVHSGTLRAVSSLPTVKLSGSPKAGAPRRRSRR